jgi:hypothetical protein
VDERIKQARLLYEQAVFTGDTAPLAEADRQLDAAEADLAVARGRILHTRFLLRRDEAPAAAASEADPGELALFERPPSCTGSSATYAARARRCSGSAVSTRSPGATTPPRFPSWSGRWSWPRRRATRP